MHTLWLLLIIPGAVFAHFSIGFPVIVWTRKTLGVDDTTFDIIDAIVWLFWPFMAAFCLVLALPNYIITVKIMYYGAKIEEV